MHDHIHITLPTNTSYRQMIETPPCIKIEWDMTLQDLTLSMFIAQRRLFSGFVSQLNGPMMGGENGDECPVPPRRAV